MSRGNAPFIKAILYADIFDYPLTQEELWHFAIANAAVRREDFKAFLAHSPPYVRKKDGYFYLAGREEVVRKRKERYSYSLKKMRYAKKIAAYLAFIPTIRFIGVSGALSLSNAKEDDDIDFFIIAASGTVWLTRLLTTIALDGKGIRRKRVGKPRNNSICVNMFLDERSLAFTKARHDLYTAHEIVQVISLLNKNMAYERFLSANFWIQTLLPNIPMQKVAEKRHRSIVGIRLLEQLAGYLQRWYMKRHMTREEVSDTILAFHPIDYRKKTLDAFAQRLAHYEKI